MPAYRYFINQELKNNQDISIEGAECKHIRSVMRLLVDDEIELVNGFGSIATAKIISVEKNCVHTQITELENFELNHKVILYQGFCKLSTLKYLVEKATELGVTEIRLYKGDRSSIDLTGSKLNRLNFKAIAGLKQSGRLFLPKISIVDPISKWSKKHTNAYFGDLSQNAKPIAIEISPDLKNIYFCNGCARGFSKKELESLESLDFTGASLHPNVLRAETAPLSFLSIYYQKLLLESNGPIIN